MPEHIIRALMRERPRPTKRIERARRYRLPEKKIILPMLLALKPRINRENFLSVTFLVPSGKLDLRRIRSILLEEDRAMAPKPYWERIKPFQGAYCPFLWTQDHRTLRSDGFLAIAATSRQVFVAKRLAGLDALSCPQIGAPSYQCKDAWAMVDQVDQRRHGHHMAIGRRIQPRHIPDS